MILSIVVCLLQFSKRTGPDFSSTFVVHMPFDQNRLCIIDNIFVIVANKYIDTGIVQLIIQYSNLGWWVVHPSPIYGYGFLIFSRYQVYPIVAQEICTYFWKQSNNMVDRRVSSVHICSLQNMSLPAFLSKH